MRSSLAERWIDRDDGHGWDGAVAAYELTRPLSDAELTEAIEIADAMLAPAGEKLALAELSRLRALTVSRQAGEDLALIFAAYAAELMAYPGDAVRSVLRAWRGKFWPSWAELADGLDRLVAPRHALREAFRLGYREPEPANDWQKPTEEDVRRVEAMLIENGIPRAVVKQAFGRPRFELPEITAEGKAQMDAEMAQWRERWASVIARAAI